MGGDQTGGIGGPWSIPIARKYLPPGSTSTRLRIRKRRPTDREIARSQHLSQALSPLSLRVKATAWYVAILLGCRKLGPEIGPRLHRTQPNFMDVGLDQHVPAATRRGSLPAEHQFKFRDPRAPIIGDYLPLRFTVNPCEAWQGGSERIVK